MFSLILLCVCKCLRCKTLIQPAAKCNHEAAASQHASAGDELTLTRTTAAAAASVIVSKKLLTPYLSVCVCVCVCSTVSWLVGGSVCV